MQVLVPQAAEPPADRMGAYSNPYTENGTSSEAAVVAAAVREQDHRGEQQAAGQ